MTVKVVDFVINNNIKKTKGIMIGLYLIKFIMYGIVLAVCVLVDKLEVFSCFGGMLAVKLMIYFKHLIVDPIRAKKSKNQNIKKDGEVIE